jgi:1-acyl-sn-glycerol-3-phosphate acyltransferase
MWLVFLTFFYVTSVSILVWSVRSSFRTMRLGERLLAGALSCPAEWRPFLKLNEPALDENRLYVNACTLGVARLWIFLALKGIIFVGCFTSRLVPFIHVVNFTCKYISRLSLGLQVEEIGQPDNSANTVVGNHVSLWDGYVILGQYYEMIVVASATVLEIPVIGRACKALGCILVDRRDSSSRHDVQRKIEEFQRTTAGTKLLIFSEGTCSNQMGVLRFKLGAFRGLRPVQPFRIEYTYRHVAFVATASEVAAAGLCFCLPASKVRLTWLPVVVPRNGETPEEFAERVRHSIAHRGLPLLDAGYGDNFALEEFAAANT